MDSVHSKWRAPKGKSKRAKQLRDARAVKKTSDPPPSTSADNETATTSEGIGRSREKFRRFQVEPVNLDDTEYIVLHTSCLRDIVSELRCCHCQSNVKLTISNRQGFAFKVVVQCCGLCGETLCDTSSSPRVPSESTRPPFDVNRKMVDAFVKAGAGYTAMQKFGTALGTKIMDQSSYRAHLSKLCEENVILKKEILRLSREAVRKAYEENDPSLLEEEIIDVMVSFDGSWHKRGHTSLYGFVSVIDVQTKLVIDFELLSKYCHICAITIAELGEGSEEFKTWYQSHIDLGECNQNFTGASGNMEREGAVILWKRSEQECKMRYTKYVSDGDAKSLSAINEAQPYGPDVLVEKEECINHVGKRLGTALRNTISNSSKLGVTLGGKGEGALTQAKVDKLQGYYQKAMIDNAPDVEKMQNAILAAPHHYASTDKKPMHQYCPKGKDSWCFFQKAKAAKPRSKPSHSALKTTLNDKVFKAILPVYQRLSERELVTRCKDLLTQNANESLHNVVWSYVPKINFMSKGRLELGATQAVGKYNMGVSAMVILEANLTERPSSAQSMRNADEIDRKRLAQSDKQAEVVAKKSRSAKKRAKKNKKTGKKDQYAPGGGD